MMESAIRAVVMRAIVTRASAMRAIVMRKETQTYIKVNFAVR